MKFFAKSLALILVILLAGVTTLWAQPQFVPPWAPNLAPQWSPVPQVPGVSYVPGFGSDLFRHGKRYYVYQDGRWYRGKHLNGPWKGIKNPPQAFYGIGPTYFKSPPGWARGNKTGWQGQPMPPGQMKKYEQGGGLPPGQMKKLERGGSLPPGQMKKMQ
jgi:hypothetical protein